MIEGRFAVALGFSTAAHVGLAWMVSAQAPLSAAPAQRALTVAMTPAAPRALLNSIAPTAVATLSPRVVQALAAPAVAVIEPRDALPVVVSSAVDTLRAPPIESRAAEQQLRAYASAARIVPLAVAPSSVRISSARQRESARKPLQLQSTPTGGASQARAATAARPAGSPAVRPAAAGARGSGAEADSAESVAGRPGANRDARPASGNEPPAYPWTARAHGQQGRVVLSVWVSAGGQPDRLAVSKSSGYPSLDRAAVEAVQHWRFQPALRGGQATASLVQVPVLFRLDDG